MAQLLKRCVIKGAMESCRRPIFLFLGCSLLGVLVYLALTFYGISSMAPGGINTVSQLDKMKHRNGTTNYSEPLFTIINTLKSTHPEAVNSSTTFETSSRTMQPAPEKIHEAAAIGSKLARIADMRRDRRVDCAAVIRNDSAAMSNAISLAEKQTKIEKKDDNSNDFFFVGTQNCSNFLKEYGFITDILSKEEEEFPIAFSIVAHTDPEMAIRLLRAVYRPQNFYCIHVDLKANHETFEIISAVAYCLPNAFLSSKRISVCWGCFSVLETELICMEDLWKHKKWKYFINLTGQEFPLKNNFELVKVLKAYKGANDVAAVYDE